MTAARHRLHGDRPSPRVLIIACGALVREVRAVLGQARLAMIDVRALPASLHNRPGAIAPAVAALLAGTQGRYDTVFVAYADCGTAGALDAVIDAHGAERLPGPHCYAFFSGVSQFEARSANDMTSFFLTDFLARQFETVVVRGLGLDHHPELREIYFSNYERLVYLSQAPTPDLIEKAKRAAGRLGLTFEHRPVGFGDLARTLDARFPERAPVPLT